MAESDLFFAIVGLLLMGCGATGLAVVVRDMIKAKHPKANPPAPHPIAGFSKEIADELDQNQSWWENRYRALLNECFEQVPFDPEEHEGHSVVSFQTYGGGTIRQECADCPTRYRAKVRHAITE